MADTALVNYSDELLRLTALAPKWTGKKLMAFSAYYRGLDRWKLRRQMYDFVAENKRTLTLIPMGHTKSTTIPRTLAVAFPCFDRNITMIIASEAKDRARKLARQARGELDSGGFKGRIREDFAVKQGANGDLTPFPFRGRVWQESQWEVAGRDPRVDHPTCVAYGLGSKLLGSRCDVILPDDIISLHNSQTEFQREKTWTWMNTHILSRLDRSGIKPWLAPDQPLPWPYGSIHMVGNHFDPRDYFTRLKEAAELADVRSIELGIHIEGFQIMERSGYTDAARTIPLLPELYTIADLEQMKIDLGTTVFELAVMNNPSGLKTLPFPETLNRYWTTNAAEIIPGRVVMRPPLKELVVQLGIDIGGDEKGHDYSAITAVGYRKRTGDIFFLDFMYGNWPTEELFDNIAEVALRWKAKTANMEAAPQRRLVDSLLMQHRWLRRILRPITPGSRAKDIRIKDALETPHAQRRLHFPLHEKYREAVTWFNHFPGIRYKDVPDSMEMSVRGLIDVPPPTPRKANLSVGSLS